MSFLKSLTNGFFTVRQAFAGWLSLHIAFTNGHDLLSHTLYGAISYAVLLFLIKE